MNVKVEDASNSDDTLDFLMTSLLGPVLVNCLLVASSRVKLFFWLRLFLAFLGPNLCFVFKFVGISSFLKSASTNLPSSVRWYNMPLVRGFLRDLRLFSESGNVLVGGTPSS